MSNCRTGILSIRASLIPTNLQIITICGYYYDVIEQQMNIFDEQLWLYHNYKGHTKRGDLS